MDIIPLEEVSKHSTEDDCWIVLFGRVLDVTSFLGVHPGGAEQILQYAGKDATKVWELLHQEEWIEEHLAQSAMKGFVSEEARAAFHERTGGPMDVVVPHVDDGSRRRLVVVGHGPVSQYFLENLIKDQTKKGLPHSAAPFAITVFCEELRPAYDRVGMSKFFEHKSAEKLNITDMKFLRQHGIVLRVGERVTAVDTARRTVTSSSGDETAYDKLVMATGSYCFVPPVKGLSAELGGVFLYRTIEDMEGMISMGEGTGCPRGAAVLGGGLLGLEAAKAILDMGVKQTMVLEGAPFLMPVQLDEQGGRCLQQMIEALGISVLVGAKVLEVVHAGGVLRGVRVVLPGGPESGELVELDMLCVSCGVRPRDELARDAGLDVAQRGGVVVNGRMESSAPDVYAIGEVASFEGRAYGLVAPGFEQARALVANLRREVDPESWDDATMTYRGSDMSTKLKLMGVDVASFGQTDAFWTDRMFDDKNDRINGGDFVFLRQHDPFSGYYRKLIFDRDQTQLVGGVCVGDASDYQVLLNLCKKGLGGRAAKDLFMGGGALEVDAGALDDSDVVCTCQGVTKGEVCEAIEELELDNMVDLKKETKCGQGCGGCVLSTGFVPKIFRSKLAEMGKEAFEGICAHFPFKRSELYEIVSVKGLRTFDEVIAAAGRGKDRTGCATCKPAVSSILSTLWNEHPMKEGLHTAQDTNDYVLANIQRSGQYSVIPRVSGGEITPDEMALLAAVAKKYGLWSKITGAQRVGLFGANQWDLPNIYEDIVTGTVDGKVICPGGMESGQAYGKALRAVKSCVGSAWCRFGQLNSVDMAVRLEERYKGLRTPHKLKGGCSGCIRDCAEARGKDFGLLATPNGYTLYLCGNHGASPKHGTVVATDLSEDEAIRLIDRALMYYVRTAGPLIRMSKWLEDLEGGITHLKAVIIDDKLGICAELENQMQRHVDNYYDEWAVVVKDPAMRKKFRQFVNTDETMYNGDLKWVDAKFDARGKQSKITPIDYPSVVGPAPVTKEDRAETWCWMFAGTLDDFPLNGGGAIKIGNSQLAVFRHRADDGKESWFATQNMCPHKRLQVLSRGLVGMDATGTTPIVACPIHKNTYSLQSGSGQSTPAFNLATFDVKIENGEVFVLTPPVAELDALLAQPDPQSLPDPELAGGCGGACGSGDGLADIEDVIPQQKSVL